MRKPGSDKAPCCSFCGSKQARAFKIADIVLRHACDECFVTRCISCGALCVDGQGRYIQQMQHAIGAALYCNACSSSKIT